jgi:hypothetical protein
MEIKISLTKDEEIVLYEDLLKKTFGSKTWGEYIGEPTTNKLAIAYGKLMTAMFGEKYKKDIEKMSLI